MRKVLCFGGGNAMPKVILKELKNFAEVYSVTSMVDSGGSTGALRKEFDVLPPGDIRRHILALSEAEEWKRKLWSFRFANDIVFEDGHKGHNFGNVFLTALEKIFGDYEKVLEVVHEFMKVKGKVMPATLEKTNLFAKTESGIILKGEHEIDIGKNKEPEDKITEIWLEPEVEAYEKVLKTIEKVDYIIIGPGDLYSSILPNFLPKGMKETIQNSAAKIIFIAPAMTKKSETYSFSLEDYVEEVEKYVGKVDIVIYNAKIPEKERMEKYKTENPEYDQLVLPESNDKRFLGKELLFDEGPIEYDSKKVIKILLEIFNNE